ncbi:hypothetical protein C4B60_13370 [Jeotgalibacillus proteolyticus]|uniref:DUF3139 domain-containing protein n=2 Tax=Jeotgalibacillus proteolyticus TaxID=2082395 RepID=A0A2S5GAC9_9BACL|nr:hypothetical protein C4B60_13370 [Jeotgalibacillus proteolyticus]
MYPTEIMEFTIVGIVIAVILMISFFFRKKMRKVGWASACVIFLAYSLFFIARPYWIDSQIKIKVELLEPYLEQNYPNEKWTIKTSAHREDGHRSSNPYYIGVIFENEQDVTYDYWVEKDEIYQISYVTNKELDDLKHRESE